MKLSMWIIANLLEPFEPEVSIRGTSPRVLHSARLAQATNCVYVQQDGPDCLYRWENDTIRVPDLPAREGFELLQSLFDSMYDWNAQLAQAAERRDYQRFVDLCHPVLGNPAILTDANHAPVALSGQYGPNDVDAEWLHLKTYGTSSFDSAWQMNQGQLTDVYDQKMVHCRVPEGSGMCDCVGAPMLWGGMPVGFFTILEKNHPLNWGHFQILELAAELLTPALAQEKPVKDELTPVFKLLLEGRSITGKAAQAFLEQKRWRQDHTYRVLIFQTRPGDDGAQRLDYFRLSALNPIFREDMCGVWKGSYVMVANETLMPQTQRRALLEQQLKTWDGKVGVSLPFPGWSAIRELATQARFALDYGGNRHKNRKFLDFYDYAMDYLIRSPYSPEGCLTASHPDVYALYRSDEVLYRTLWVYLVQDRSVTRTIQYLFVHKNTLLHRLRRIEESLTYSLSDAYSREYMRLSFGLLERHAGLPTPPETPFPEEHPETRSE